MADRYWVGGTGTWNGTNTANWSTSSGGGGGASVPTSADNVFFDADSNTSTQAFTVTIATTAANCLNWDSTAVDGTMTVAGSVALNVYGSFNLKATQHTWSHTGSIYLKGTSAGLNFNPNGISLSNDRIYMDGAAGEYTLGSALTATTLDVRQGTFKTNNFNLTLANLDVGNTSNTRTLELGSSTVSLTNRFTATITTGLTFTPGTSTINLTTALTTFSPNGLTLYDFGITTSTTGNYDHTISNSFTCRNFTVASIGTTTSGQSRKIIFSSNDSVTVTCTGTLTVGGGTDRATRTIFGQSLSIAAGVYDKITISAATYSLADVDVHGVAFTGAGAPATGTSIGDLGNCSGVTFTEAKTVYKTSASTAWVSATWATSSGGTASKNNFPLGQDTIIIDDSSGTSLSLAVSGSFLSHCAKLDASARSTAFTLDGSSSALYLAGDTGTFKVNTNTTYTTSVFAMVVQGTGVFSLDLPSTSYSFPVNLYVAQVLGGSTKLVNNLTNSYTTNTRVVSIRAGTLDLNGKTWSWSGTFTIAGLDSWTKALTYGSGGMLTINARAGVTSGIIDYSNTTNFTVTADPTTGLRPITYAGNAAITVTTLASGTATEANGPDVYVTATLTALTFGSLNVRHIDLTGSTITTFTSSTINCYGNFILSSGITTMAASNNTTTLRSTSATERLIDFAGKNFDAPITINAPGGSYKLVSNTTVTNATSNRIFALTAGTLNLNGKVLTTPVFDTSNSNTRVVDFSTAGSRIDVTGNNVTVLGFTNCTNLTFVGTSQFRALYSGSVGTRYLDGPSIGDSSSNKLNYEVTAGSDTIVVSNRINTLDFSGGTFTGTVGLAGRTFGTLKLKTGMTVTASTGTITIAQYSGDTGYLLTAGLAIAVNITVSTDGTTELSDALTLTAARTLSASKGNFKTNNFAVTCGSFQSSSSNTRVVDIGASTVTLNGSGSALYFSTATGLSFAFTTGKFSIASTAPNTCTMPNTAIDVPTINIATSQVITIAQSGAIYTDFTNSVTPASVTFGNNFSATVKNFNLNGTAGNLVTITTLTVGNIHTLTKTTAGDVSCDYLSISRSVVTGSGAGAGVKWYAGANSTDGGNNTGWIFTAPPMAVDDGEFFSFFNWA